MAFFPLLRLIALALLALFSVLVLSLAAAVLAQGGTVSLDRPNLSAFAVLTPAAPGFAIAVSLITLFAVVPSLLFLLLIPNEAPRFLSFAWVEIIWVWVLWVFWLAAASYLQSNSFLSTISSEFGIDLCGSRCGEVRALDAFAWLAWLTVSAYMGVLIVAVFISARRSNRSFQALEIQQILEESPTEQMQLGPTGVAAEKTQA